MKTGLVARSFTLIELMCASTLLSVILLMMVGMQDQMSKAWRNSNRRMDATREARAALRMMSSDLGNLYFRTNTWGSTMAYNPSRSPIPMAILNDDARATTLPIANAQTGSVAIFALVQRQSSVPNPNAVFDEFCAVGYYIGSAEDVDVNGFKRTSYNLYRYFRTGAELTPALITYLQARSPLASVRGIFSPSTNDDILARNACNLQVTVYPRTNADGVTVPANGLVFSVIEGMGNRTFYHGNKIQFELTTYPDDVVASGVLGGLTNWSKASNVQKYGRTFEGRKNLEIDK
jgi:type II secretory pathway pseudopilin PulG